MDVRNGLNQLKLRARGQPLMTATTPLLVEASCAVKLSVPA